MNPALGYLILLAVVDITCILDVYDKCRQRWGRSAAVTAVIVPHIMAVPMVLSLI